MYISQAPPFLSVSSGIVLVYPWESVPSAPLILILANCCALPGNFPEDQIGKIKRATQKGEAAQWLSETFKGKHCQVLWFCQPLDTVLLCKDHFFKTGHRNCPCWVPTSLSFLKIARSSSAKNNIWDICLSVKHTFVMTQYMLNGSLLNFPRGKNPLEVRKPERRDQEEKTQVEPRTEQPANLVSEVLTCSPSTPDNLVLQQAGCELILPEPRANVTPVRPSLTSGSCSCPLSPQNTL